MMDLEQSATSMLTFTDLRCAAVLLCALHRQECVDVGAHVMHTKPADVLLA